MSLSLLFYFFSGLLFSNRNIFHFFLLVLHIKSEVKEEMMSLELLETFYFETAGKEVIHFTEKSLIEINWKADHVSSEEYKAFTQLLSHHVCVCVCVCVFQIVLLRNLMELYPCVTLQQRVAPCLVYIRWTSCFLGRRPSRVTDCLFCDSGGRSREPSWRPSQVFHEAVPEGLALPTFNPVQSGTDRARRAEWSPTELPGARGRLQLDARPFRGQYHWRRLVLF